MAVPYRTRSTRLFTSPDELEAAVRVGAESLVLQWLTLFRAIGIMRALVEQQALQSAAPSLAATAPVSTAVEDRYVVPGVGFAWDGDI